MQGPLLSVLYCRSARWLCPNWLTIPEKKGRYSFPDADRVYSDLISSCEPNVSSRILVVQNYSRSLRAIFVLLVIQYDQMYLSSPLLTVDLRRLACCQAANSTSNRRCAVTARSTREHPVVGKLSSVFRENRDHGPDLNDGRSSHALCDVSVSLGSSKRMSLSSQQTSQIVRRRRRDVG